MEVVRKIVRSDMLLPIIDLPWASKDLQVEVIVIPRLAKMTKQRKVSVDNIEGCLQAYAKPALWEKEQHAWEDVIIEKHGHI
jgi:hypothetical protein